MRLQPNAQIEIARRGAAGARLALAPDSHSRTVADAGRDTHVHAASVAVVLDREAAGDALVRFFERQRELVLEIASLSGPASRRPCTARRGAPAAAEEGVEEVRARRVRPDRPLHLLLGIPPHAA